MKALITGGTGFIGSRLALKLLADGATVRILGQVNNDAEADNKRSVEQEGAEVVLGSVTEREQLFELTEGIDLVYHLAAAQHEANIPDEKFWEVNVTGTKNMLEASVEAGVSRFVHGSTIGVYGAAMAGRMDEQSPLKPDNIYGVTKLEAEKLVLAFQKKLLVVVIRISETYGPGDRRLLKLFKAIEKNFFFMIGNGQNLHHLIYVDDLIDGLCLAATAESAVGNTFVLAGKEPMTTNDMVAIIAEELDTKIRQMRAPLPLFLLLAMIMEAMLRPIGLQPPLHRRRMDFFRKSFVFSTELASSCLGFAPRYGFKQGVAETASWYTKMGLL
jgi:nucleoside-diphosphate-sugar epimerase